MGSSPLHPLARQSLLASTIPACHGWAFGMTKYLARDDPSGCVQWTLDVIRPYLSEEGEHGGVVTRSLQLLGDVLDDPLSADLKQMDAFVWEPWNHRRSYGAGPLARLIWAAMGVVEQAAPGKAAQLPDAYMFPPKENHPEIAERLVWNQSATAIQMLADDRPDVLQAAAEAFTGKVCNAQRPLNCDVVSRFRWAWNDIVYEIDTLTTPGAFFIEFTDCAVDGQLFSGAFASMEDVNDHMDRLRHRPTVIKITPVVR